MSSIMGGFSISIGFLCYANCYNAVGAVLFSIGLYLVLWNNYNLFTGKIGYCHNIKDFVSCFWILIGNGIGCSLSFIVSIPVEIVENKINQPLGIVFIKACVCGFLVFTAVELYKKGKLFAPLLIVSCFILSGAEHCIANLCFIFSARYWTWRALSFLIVVIFGNSLGSLIFQKKYVIIFIEKSRKERTQ